MAEPSIDPNWLQSAWQWLVSICGGLFGFWKYIDVKVSAVHAKIDAKADSEDLTAALARLDKTNVHIERLYKNAEADRKFTRDLHDKAMDTISLNQREVLAAIKVRK